MKVWWRASILGLAAACLLPAAPPSGKLDITGSVVMGLTTIDWSPAGGGTGAFIVRPSSTGSFAALAGTSGTAVDLNLLVQSVNTPIVLTNFLTFAAAPTLHLDLNFIFLGVSSSAACFAVPATGQVCSPPIALLVTPANPSGISPLNFKNLPTGSAASFAVSGSVTDGSGTSTFTGVITTQFAPEFYQSVLATLAAPGTLFRSFSASFLVTPST
jgi:hypothetical protein